MRLSKFCFLVGFLIFVSAQSVFAQSYREEGVRIGQNEFKDINGFRIGQASLKAGVSTEADFDSNVYLTSNNKKRDYINAVSYTHLTLPTKRIV